MSGSLPLGPFLLRVRALLLQGWCRYSLARTADGSWCFSTDSQGTAWSLRGAIERAENEAICMHGPVLGWDVRARAVVLFQRIVGVENLHDWNDAQPNVARVLAAVDTVLVLALIRERRADQRRRTSPSRAA